MTRVRSVLKYMKKGEDRGEGSEIAKKGVIMYLNSPLLVEKWPYAKLEFQ